MFDTVLLSKATAKKTGYTKEEARDILLGKMDRTTMRYKDAISSNAVEPNSWAAITLCYETDNPIAYIKELGKKGG